MQVTPLLAKVQTWDVSLLLGCFVQWQTQAAPFGLAGFCNLVYRL